MLKCSQHVGCLPKNFSKQQSWVAKCHVFYIKHSSGSKVAQGKKKREENVIKTLPAVRNIVFPHRQNVWAMSWWDQGILFLFPLKGPSLISFLHFPSQRVALYCAGWGKCISISIQKQGYMMVSLHVDFASGFWVEKRLFKQCQYQNIY